jgi:hypothetical protein
MNEELENLYISVLDNLSKMASEERFADKAKEAYEIYTSKVGGIYSEDRSYESRMTLFLEWFIFECQAIQTGESVLEVYKDEMARGSDAELNLVAAMKDHVRDVFLVKSSKAGVIKAQALYENGKYVICDSYRADLFSKGELFEARIVEVDGNWRLTNGFCHHPSAALKFIKEEMKRIRKASGNGLDEFFFQLAAMSMKLERSRQIEVTQIYKSS